MTDKEAYVKMLEILNATTAVVTATQIHPDIPTVHDISHREGCRLRCDTELRHAGFGLFLAEVGGKRFSFDGGGAMRRAETFSWTPLRFETPGLAELGYDVEAAREALTELAA